MSQWNKPHKRRNVSPSQLRLKTKPNDTRSDGACSMARLAIPSILREAACHLEHNGVMRNCCDGHLTAYCTGIREAYLFENSGCFDKKVSQKTVLDLRNKCFDNNVSDLLATVDDPNIVAGLLLHFFREQKAPLLVCQLYDAWIGCSGAFVLLHPAEKR